MKKISQHGTTKRGSGSATYLSVKCFDCGHKDAIRADYYRPRGGEFWCDECGAVREYEPDN